MNSVKCSECGFVGWADVEFCKKCGTSLRPDSVDGSRSARQGYTTYQPGGGGRLHPELKKGLAICSLVIGIINFFTLGFLGVGALVGMTLAIVALIKINRNPWKYGGKGLATAGLVTSMLSVVMIVPVGLIAAIAVPNLLAAARAANEGAAQSTLRTIYNAEATYYDAHKTYGTMDQLAADQLIAADLGSATRHGYKFKVDVSTTGSHGQVAFEVVGVPVKYPMTGRRSFYVDETGVIRAGDKQGADATSTDSPLDSEHDYSSDSPSTPRADSSTR